MHGTIRRKCASGGRIQPSSQRGPVDRFDLRQIAHELTFVAPLAVARRAGHCFRRPQRIKTLFDFSQVAVPAALVVEPLYVRLLLCRFVDRPTKGLDDVLVLGDPRRLGRLSNSCLISDTPQTRRFAGSQLLDMVGPILFPSCGEFSMYGSSGTIRNIQLGWQPSRRHHHRQGVQLARPECAGSDVRRVTRRRPLLCEAVTTIPYSPVDSS